MAVQTLKNILKTQTVEGELYEKLEGDKLRCFACGHRCVILPGLDGICRVRYNEGGRLMVPAGYVGGLQCDPTEKKPYFHAYPGSLALTFGMLGCDLHCAYCFTGDTVVITGDGPKTFEELFTSAPRVDRLPDAEIAYPTDLRAVAASGTLRPVRAVFKHSYRGKMVAVRPYYLPELRCTPDHRFYATTDPKIGLSLVRAEDLTSNHFLAIPRSFTFQEAGDFDIAAALTHHRITYRAPFRIDSAVRRAIIEATERGETSKQIGLALGKDPSHIRHIRSKVARGAVSETRTRGVIVAESSVRFPNEHRPGIPSSLPIDERLAALFGYYCAEGCVTQSRFRPNSLCLNFSFAPDEIDTAAKVIRLLKDCLGVEARIVPRSTTLGVSAAKASAALLFKSVAGSRATGKRVPDFLFHAPVEIVRAFLDACVEGDGHRYANGQVSVTTVSRELAFGVAWLALKTGHAPSVYDNQPAPTSEVQGRKVKRAEHQYTVVWYEGGGVRRRLVETEAFYLIPVRSIAAFDFEGDVFNMEVEEEHNYMAGFLLAANCQNWVTSQALRDPQAVAPPQAVTPEEMVRIARRRGARLVVSSYNEPLITSEWAVAVFKEATRAGFICGFVSNGNATPEVLDYIRPYTELYKIDLKSFNDRNYRKLGGVLENILNSIRMVHERGFWLEIVTLLIPGFNDAEDELRGAADFLASVSPDIPWHVTAFHQDYKMTSPDNTSAEMLQRAAEIGRSAGLRFVYAGNLPGRVGDLENTYCPQCRALLIERFGFRVLRNRMKDGACPDCGTAIPGRW